MRYGNPSLLSGLQELHDKGVTEVLLPLYPQCHGYYYNHRTG
jgi:ferrochelatase